MIYSGFYFVINFPDFLGFCSKKITIPGIWDFLDFAFGIFLRENLNLGIGIPKNTMPKPPLLIIFIQTSRVLKLRTSSRRRRRRTWRTRCPSFQQPIRSRIASSSRCRRRTTRCANPSRSSRTWPTDSSASATKPTKTWNRRCANWAKLPNPTGPTHFRQLLFPCNQFYIRISFFDHSSHIRDSPFRTKIFQCSLVLPEIG